MGSVQGEGELQKTRVEFERAAEVFRDPLALTITDEEHSETENRWITLGKESVGQYVLVVHTFEQLTRESGRVRLISARRPTVRKSAPTKKSDET